MPRKPLGVTVQASRPQSITTSRRRRRARTRALLRHAHDAPDRSAREAAIHEAIEINIEVARSLASAYVGRGIPREDLEQVACTALVRAAQEFDPGRASDFLSYAVPTIRGELRKHFRDNGWTVRPPRRIQELQAAVSQARARLEQTCGQVPTAADIAAEIGESASAVEEALAADGCFAPSSLDRRVSDNGPATLGDLLPASDGDLEAAEARLMLDPVVRRLCPRDRLILRMRFWEGLTQREIGEEIGVTQMQVSRLLTRILDELRNEISDELATSA